MTAVSFTANSVTTSNLKKEDLRTTTEARRQGTFQGHAPQITAWAPQARKYDRVNVL